MLRWTAQIVDACPQFCLRCEMRITKIILSHGLAIGIVMVRCGHCGRFLGRVPSRWLQPERRPEKVLHTDPDDGSESISA